MNGVSASGIESIAGDSAADLVSEMLEMKYSTKTTSCTIRPRVIAKTKFAQWRRISLLYLKVEGLTNV